MVNKFLYSRGGCENYMLFLADELKKLGFDLVSGGTDNHLILIDLRNKNITGKELLRYENAPKNSKWYYPIASIGFPLAYAIFLLIQAIILDFNTSILIPTTTTPLIYPYFFVNLETQGVFGVLMWVGILAVAFIVVGYLFYGLDRLGKKGARH